MLCIRPLHMAFVDAGAYLNEKSVSSWRKENLDDVEDTLGAGFILALTGQDIFTDMNIDI